MKKVLNVNKKITEDFYEFFIKSNEMPNSKYFNINVIGEISETEGSLCHVKTTACKCLINCVPLVKKFTKMDMNVKIILPKIYYPSAQTEFIKEYLKNNYNFYLERNEEIYEHILFAICHEFGHLINNIEYSNKHRGELDNTSNEYYKNISSWEEYREIPNEKNADLKAMKLIEKYYDKLINIIKENINN